MNQQKQLELIQQEIENSLASVSGIVDFHNILNEALLIFGRISSRETNTLYSWALLPVIICEAISGHYKSAIPLSAAILLFNSAAEVFDDIEDSDSRDSISAKYGAPVATNVATTLLILAEKTIIRLKDTGVQDSSIVRIIETINSYYSTTCIGQYLDISIDPGVILSEEQYLNIAAMKSASYMECSCCVGTILAEAESNIVSLFCKFGHNIGIAAQIANDIKGIIDGKDIFKRKITLPIIYALAQTNGEVYNKLEAIFYKKTMQVDPKEISNLLFKTGAIHYTTIKMELFQQNARSALAEAEKMGIDTEQLKVFII